MEIPSIIMGALKQGNRSAVSRRGFLGGVASFLLARGEEAPSVVPLEIIVVPDLAEAEEIMRLLKGGESFGWLAAHSSTDPSRAVNGYIGRMNLSAMASELGTAVKDLRLGQTTGIVQTPSGYVILKLISEESVLRNERLLKARADEQVQIDYPLVTGVSGSKEEEGVVERFPKPPNFQQDLKACCETRRKAVEDGISRLNRDLQILSTEPRDPALSCYMKTVVHVALGQM